MSDDGEDAEAAKKSGVTGRPTNTVVWDNVRQEEYTKDDGSTMLRQTCVHCGRINNAKKPQTTWWALHLVDRDKGCQNTPLAVRHTILNTTTSAQVRTAGMSLFGVSVGAKRSRKGALPPPPQTTTLGPGTRRGLGKLLEDNIEVEEGPDGMLSQTCRHCKRNRTCKQMLATVWSMHFVDISPKGCPDCPFYVRRAIAQESSSSAVKRLAESQGWFLDGGVGVDDDDDMDQKPRGPGRPPKRAKTSSHIPLKPPSTSAGQAGGILTQTQVNSINIKVMQFIAACGHSMLLVQSPVFLELLRALNEEYVKRHLSKADVFVKAWLPKLYLSVQQQLSSLWNEQRKQQSMATLGLWDEMPQFLKGPSVKILTEGMVDKLACWETVSASSEGETADGLAQHLSNHMVAKAGDETKVEDTYGAVVMTTSSLNVEVGKIIQERFPKLFVNRCRHQSLQIMKDRIFQTHEIAKVYSNSQFLAHFVLDHPNSSTIFAGLVSEKGGCMPIPADSQDFGPVHKLLESLCGPNGINSDIFTALVRDPKWASLKMGTQLVQQFESLVSDQETFSKVHALSKLLGPLAAFEEHLNRPECRASWIYALVEALLKDVADWCSDAGVTLAFKSQETFDSVSSAVYRCWRGDGLNEESYGLFSPQILLAMLLDPTTCPTSDTLPPDWEAESEKVLKVFYGGKELLDANAELMTILDHQGKFGSHVERFQEAMKTVLPMVESRTHVQTVVDRHLQAMDTVPHLVWKLSLRSSFPLLSEVARRLLVMGTTSIDASWTRKVEMALGGSGLKSKNVLMLLYCHINLRVIKYKDNRSNGAGNDDSNSFEDFIGQALLDETEPAEAVEMKMESPAAVEESHPMPPLDVGPGQATLLV